MEEADVFTDASQGDQEIGVTVIKQEEPIDFPKMLKIFAFEKGNISDFPQVNLSCNEFDLRCIVVFMDFCLYGFYFRPVDCMCMCIFDVHI